MTKHKRGYDPFVDAMEDAILEYNKREYKLPISGSHFTETYLILFKGNDELCEELKEMIKKHLKEKQPELLPGGKK